MPCAICGSPETVKSHIIPRSLFHMARRPGKQIIANRRDGQIGYQILQSGYWDDRILCVKHEGMLGSCDEYAAKFCRRFVERAPAEDRKITIENKAPHLLVSFAAACVWRHAVSRSEGSPAKMLGPYADRLRDRLFSGGDFDPMLMISRSAFVANRETFHIGLQPHIHFELGIRFWRFAVCGLLFDLKLDNRATPSLMKIFEVNQQLSVTLFEDFPHDVTRDPQIAPSIARLHARR